MQKTVDPGPTRNAQLILEIVDAIYAAACGEATWDQILARICRLGMLDGAALSTVGADEPQRVPLAGFGLASRMNTVALRGAAADDSALVDSILRSPLGAVLRDGQIKSTAPTAQSHSTGAVPVIGSDAWACIIVGKDGRRLVCLEVYRRGERPPGRLEPHDLLREVAPHLVRAWRLGAASLPAPVTPLCVEPRSLARGDVAPSADLVCVPETARLRAEFGLTKAEARLALRLAEGSSLASAAQTFGVKLTTIRSQLQQVFAKTGASRQSELVAMLLSGGYVYRRPPRNSYTSTQAEVALAG